MPYNVIADDNFARANTAVGTSANSTNVTGPGTFNSPSTGANYVDLEGTHYAINNNALTAAAVVSGGYSSSLLLRPAAESEKDGQIAITFTPGSPNGAVASAIARWISGVGCYAAGMYYSNGFGGWIVNLSKYGTTAGSQTVLAASGTLPAATFNAGTPYIMTLKATGSSPTTLSVTIAAAATPGTILYSNTVTDSTAALQASGQWGLSANNYSASSGTSPVTFSHLTTSYLSAAAAVTISPTTATVAPNGTQAFSIALDGTLANGTSVTINLGVTSGTLSASSVTFTGTGIQPAPQTVTYTAPSSNGAATLSGTNTGSLTNFANVPLTIQNPPLSMGTLSLSETNGNGIVISTSAPLANGTGTGYSYAIYRGTNPNFVANGSSLLATVTSLPYTDATAVSGTQYFYGVVGTDSSAATVNALPTGLTGANSAVLYYASATPNTKALNFIFVGDSTTFGATLTSNAGTVLSPTAPFFCMNKLKKIFGTRNIFGVNAGASGKSTTDWLPATNTYYHSTILAANTSSSASLLNTANPDAQMCFNISLGGNDSASAGTNNGGVSGGLTPTQYVANLKAIIDQILNVDWPNAKDFVHLPPSYSPNFKNAATYLQDGLSRLYSYRGPTQALILQYAASKPNQVFLGDTFAFDYFAKNYASEQTQETYAGGNGNFYVHPSGLIDANGNIGTQSLGEMWAQAIAIPLYADLGISYRSYNFT